MKNIEGSMFIVVLNGKVSVKTNCLKLKDKQKLLHFVLEDLIMEELEKENEDE